MNKDDAKMLDNDFVSLYTGSAYLKNFYFVKGLKCMFLCVRASVGILFPSTGKQGVP